MQFLNPTALLSLVLIPVLIFIHNLKPRRRHVDITNLFLWEETFEEQSSGFRIQEIIIRNLPLALQIFIVLLASLALSEPVLLYHSQQAGNAVLIMDTSASMKTRTSSGTRFDKARNEALRLVKALPARNKMLIINAGREPAIKTNFTDDKNQLREAVKDIKPNDVKGEMEKAILLALSFIDHTEDDSIYLITDGADSNYTNLIKTYGMVKPIIVTGGEKNVGITNFNFRQGADFGDQYEIMLVIKNYNPDPVKFPYSLSLEDTTLLKDIVELKPFEKRLFFFPYTGLISGRVRISIDIDDDFSTDNTAWSVLNPSKDTWILLVSKGNYFLEKLLKSYPNFMVNSIKEIIPSSWKEQVLQHDIIILDQVSFPEVKKGNFLLLNSFSPSIPVVKTGQIEWPEILDWNKKNPLLNGVDLRDIAIKNASRIKTDSAFKPIVETNQTGLMVVYQEKGLRAVFLGFDIKESNLPLKVAFPVMMSNIFQFLNPDAFHFSSSQVKSGEPYKIFLKTETSALSIRTPSGKWEEPLVNTNPFIFKNTNETGIYTIEENGKWRHFAVNLADETESKIRQAHIEPGIIENLKTSSSSDIKTDSVKSKLPLWLFLLIPVPAILILEWYTWFKFSEVR